MLELLLFWGWGVGGIRPRKGTGFFIILLFEKHIYQFIFYSWVFVGWLGGGCVFEHPPNVRTRFIAFALWGVGGNALVGWNTGYSLGGRVGDAFSNTPQSADAVYCVRALGGGRKRRGGEE